MTLACVLAMAGAAVAAYALGVLVTRWRWRHTPGRHRGRFLRGH